MARLIFLGIFCGLPGTPGAWAVGQATTVPSLLLVLKTAPPDAAAFLDGSALSLTPGANGSRNALVSLGKHELLLVADGYIATKLKIEVIDAGMRIETKLERPGSALSLAGQGATGPRPKSVTFTPDGRLLLCPLLSGRGIDVLDAVTLAFRGRLEPPPGLAKAEGFVETAVVPGLSEIWVSQMHNSMIHVFDLASLAYKESFPSGGSYPKVIAISPDGSQAFVSNWVSEDVSIIETKSRKLLARISVGTVPRGLCPSPDGTALFIAGFGAGSIMRLDLHSRRISVLWKPDGGAKRHLVLDSSRKRLYATDMARDSLFVLDYTTGALIAEIPIGSNPNTCVLSPDGEWVYVCTRGPNGKDGYEKPGPLAGELVAVNAEALAVAYRQWGGNQPTGLALSPGGTRIVFTDFLDMRVEAYDIGPPIFEIRKPH